MVLSERVVIVTKVLSEVGASLTTMVHPGARVILVLSEMKAERRTGQTTET
jgi:hypothetical protein